MNYYIYLTTNLINGKKYIGQHKGELNDFYFGSGVLITKALEKYGKDNFKKEILEICSSREEADEKEKFYISKYNAIEDETFYNLQEGGTRGDGWRSAQRWLNSHPEEAKEIYKQNGERLQWWRQKNSEQQAKKCLESFLEGSKKWKKEHPEEVKNIMKKVNEKKEEWQKTHPEEHQKQMEEWRQKGTETNSIKILCVTTNEIFNSISEAGRYYNVAQPNITKCLKGQRKSAGKHPVTKEKLIWKKIEK